MNTIVVRKRGRGARYYNPWGLFLCLQCREGVHLISSLFCHPCSILKKHEGGMRGERGFHSTPEMISHTDADARHVMVHA